MRIVLDTNVLIAAFIARGACNELLEHCALNHDIVLSHFILAEFKEKLVNKFDFTSREASPRYSAPEISWHNRPKTLDGPICRDPDDDNIIGTAVAGSCDCIVTGDKDLLDLKSALGIPIIAPSQFWEFESK